MSKKEQPKGPGFFESNTQGGLTIAPDGDAIISTLNHTEHHHHAPSSEVDLAKVEQKISAYCQKIYNDKDMLEVHKVYVPVQASVSRNYLSRFDLAQEVTTRFLAPQSPHKTLLLQGNSGSGKTMFCQHLAVTLAKGYHEDGVIPLYISLPSVPDVLDQLIHQHLKHHRFDDAEIKFLQANRAFVFILDSYDEVAQFKKNEVANLYTANKLYDWDARCIISCRTTYITGLRNYKRYFMPYALEGPRPREFREIYVAPFSRNEIERYIQLYLQYAADDLKLAIEMGDVDEKWLTREAFLQCIEELHGLKEIIENPFLLKITMTVLPKTAEKYEEELSTSKRRLVTSLDLYEQYATWWFDRQLDKLIFHSGGVIQDSRGTIMQISTEDYEVFSKRLAVAMDAAEVTIVSSDMEGFRQFFAKNDERLVMIRKGCPLSQNAQADRWSFIHVNLQDYFVSKDMLEQKLKLEEQLRALEDEQGAAVIENGDVEEVSLSSTM